MSSFDELKAAGANALGPQTKGCVSCFGLLRHSESSGYSSAAKSK